VPEPENPDTIDVAPEQDYYTADMVRALIREDRAWPRYECVYGELLVTPAPRARHNIVAERIHGRLNGYIDAQAVEAHAIMSPSDVSWGRKDTTVQPDVFVVPRSAYRELWRANSWELIRHLLLACEVISPSSRKTDRFRKRILYQQQRVPLYWIVDPEQELAEVWTPDDEFPVIERERLAWHPEGTAEPLVITLAALFAEP